MPVPPSSRFPWSRALPGLLFLRNWAPGFVAGCLLATGGPGIASQARTWGEQYRHIPASYGRIIERGEKAFMAKDAEALGASLAEDYSSYQVTDGGPKAGVRGRQAAVDLMKKMFASPKWTSPGDSEIHRLGMVGNTLVQVEVDTMATDKGPVRQTSLNVYEYKDGKVWRAFKFHPKDL